MPRIHVATEYRILPKFGRWHALILLLLNTGRQDKVADALDGKVLGDGPEVTLTLKKGEVRVIRCP